MLATLVNYGWTILNVNRGKKQLLIALFNCGIENLSNLIVICEIGLQLLMWSNSVAKTLISSSNFGVLQVLLPLLVGVEVVLSPLLVSGHVLIGRTLSLAGELGLNCNRTKSKPELTIFYDTTSSWPDLVLALAPALAWTGPLASESAGSLLSFSSLSPFSSPSFSLLLNFVYLFSQEPHSEQICLMPGKGILLWSESHPRAQPKRQSN